jgi:hypothetical protein
VTTSATASAVSGQVYGGQQAISGAEVMLWQVNTNTSGTSLAATPLLNAPVLTSGTGGFSLTGFITNFSSICYPTAGVGPQVYVTATLGNPGAGTNNSLALMTAIGTCSQLTTSSHIQVNEATTVAAAWALQQFFGVAEGAAPSPSTGSPGENIVTAGTAQSNAGMANAFLTANLLVPYSTGAVTTNPAIAVQADKIYAIANILAACVNSDGTGDCPNLFSAVTPAGSIFPGDTIQAALYIAQNPSYNVPAIYALQSATPPFPSALTSAPFDWSLAITYSGTGFALPNLVASDASGNIWVTNAQSGINSLLEIAPGGSVSSYLTGSSAFSQPQSDVIDTNGNIWISAHSSTQSIGNRLVEYKPATSSSTSYPNALPSGCLPYNVAIDGNNDVFVACNGLSTPALYELAAPISGNPAASLIGSLNGSTETYGMAVDSDSNVWAANTQTYTGMTEFTAATSGAASSINNFALGTGAYGVAIDNGNNAWAVNSGFLEKFAINAKTSSAPTYTTSNYTGAGLTSGGAIAVDGAGNLWASNRNTNLIGGSTYISVSEFSNAGTPVTPANTTTQPGGLTAAAVVNGVNVTDAQPRGLAIDPSGNVWIAGCNLSTSCAAGLSGNSNVGKYSFVMEFVGAAVPPVLPLSSAVAANQLGCCSFTHVPPTGISPTANAGYVGLQASTTAGNPAFTQNGGQFYFLVTRSGGFTGSLNIRYSYAAPSTGTGAVYNTDYTDTTSSATGITPYSTSTGYGTLTWTNGDSSSRTIGPINWSDVTANGPTKAFVINLTCSVNCPTGYSPYQSETVSVTAAATAPSTSASFDSYFAGTQTGNNASSASMYLGLPIDQYGGNGGLNGAQFAEQTITPAGLAAGFSDAYFYLNANGDMVFIAPSNGATSSPGVGTNDVRTELREYYKKTGYVGNYDWDSAIGGTLVANVAVNATSVDTNEATIGQIHGENQPFALLQYQPSCTFNSNSYTGCVVLAYNSTNTTSSASNSVLLADGIPLNTFFSYKLAFSGSTLTAGVTSISGTGTTNGTQTISNIDSSWIGTASADGMYFKIGAYSGAPNTGNPSGDQTEVTVHSFTITHP